MCRILVTTLMLAAVTAPRTHGQRSFFEEGNRLYQQGDYRGAIDSYLQILEAGMESGDLYYNLGNAYFKAGELGSAILYYERASRLLPRDQDVSANLDLARSLTADEITPLPRFWVLRVVGWWVRLLPLSLLRFVAGAAYLIAMGGLVVFVLRRGSSVAVWAGRVALVGVATLVLFGANLAVLELGIGQAETAIVMSDEVEVQSAPSDDSALQVFTIHEGTKVRIDRRADEWVEIVLEDGKVGWVRADALERI